MQPLRDALVGFADWLGYRHAGRADAWLARLEVNRPEIDAFRSAPDSDREPYRAARTEVLPASGLGRGADALPVDATRACREATGRANLNAFTWIASVPKAGGPGLLEGVPIAVKDLMKVQGAPLSGGSAAFDRDICTSDAEVVARLRRAGAVVVGLTNLHEFAYGITSDNPHFGRVVNPAAPDRIPGGSSGGSAAAIAAGIVPLAIGTDTAGSIRIPAACCGIVGFKPSYDALPRDGVLDLAATLDHVGPMGRNVDACARMFAAMLDLREEPAWTLDNLSRRTAVRLRGYFEQPIDAQVSAALDEAMIAAAADGAVCVDREIDGMALAPAIQFNTICPEALAVHADRLAARGAEMGEDVRVRLEIGHFLPGYWYVKAQRMRRALVDRIERAFDGADFLVCATLRTTAPPIGASRVDIGGKSFALHTAVTHLTLPFNLAGLPAVSFPWTRSKEGVPVCVQVVGRRGHDWETLAFARRLEKAAPWKGATA